jgi:hypothetical protein
MKLNIVQTFFRCIVSASIYGTRFIRMYREALPFVVLVTVCGTVPVSSALAHCETISVTRSSDGFTQFSLGAQPYVAIGVNYFHLHQGPPYASFDTFDPGEFDAKAVEEAFSHMKRSRYNYVRLFLSGFYPDRGFDRTNRSIADDYLENIRQAIKLADKYGLHVVLTGSFRPGQWLPQNYMPHVPDTRVGGINQLLFVSDYADSTATFYRDFLVGLKSKDSNLLSCIFYLDLYNELQFDINQPPFSLRSGKFSFAGTDYDLADSEERQRLADAAAGAWLRKAIAAVRQADPALLTTASTFPNSAFGHAGFDGGRANARSKTSDRNPYPVRPEVLRAAGADLLDIHLYPYPATYATPRLALHDDLPRVLSSSGVTAATARTLPVVVGELGALKSAFATPRSAVNELQATLAALCNYHISGWAFWLWDGPGTTWALTDDSNALNSALAPDNHQEACRSRKIQSER